MAHKDPEARRAYLRLWNAKPENKERRRLQRQTPRYKARMHEYHKQWRESPQGRAKKRAAQSRYKETQRFRAKALEYSWRQYGLVGATYAGYQVLLAQQGGVCALCGSPPKKKALAWDHDHRTGAPRGLLCNLCNRRLADLEDSTWALRAKAYLVRHRKQTA